VSGRLKALLASAGIVVALLAAAAFAAIAFLTEQRPQAALEAARSALIVFLYERGVVGELTPAEAARLYRDSCTRKCHGKDVVEGKPRTAAEWETVLSRMAAPDRAALGDRAAGAVTRHLQTHFLSNVPTVLPDAIMRFVRKHLWRSDFGEGDLFLDLVHVPREHGRLLPYLGVRDVEPPPRGALFVVFLNTHRGSVPPWNLAEMATLRAGDGQSQAASGWKVLYGDAQQHHRQGLLRFDDANIHDAGEVEVRLDLPGLGTRTFLWHLPVPALPL
jgi:hypothetical protein